MTIRFAPARVPARFWSRIVKHETASLSGRGANDNGPVAANDDAVLADTLRHFAEHGLSAAQSARDKAVRACKSGDEKGLDRWLSVCRMLDQRMAEGVARELPSRK